MIQDDNKNITAITYNHMNLPTQVDINSDNITYIYDATGIKLKKTVSTTGAATEYAGNYIYENATLQFFNQSEGYVEPLNAGDYSQGFNYIYQYKDHLGNIRLSFGDNNDDGTVDPAAEIRKESNYYPFGLSHKGYNSMRIGRNHTFEYQGQESQAELELGWQSFKWRNHDPAIGRFMSVDPLSEKYAYQSSYNFAENKVISGMELEGLEHLDANVARIKVMRGKVFLNVKNMSFITRSNIRSMNNNPKYSTSENLGADTRMGSFSFSSTQAESTKSIPLAKKNGVPVSARDIGKTNIQNPIAKSTGKPDRRYKQRRIGGVSVRAKGTGAALAAYNIALTGFEYYSIFSIESDKSLTDDHFENALPSAIDDINSALMDGLIPDDLLNESDLSDLLNVILQGDVAEPSIDKNSLEYWRKIMIGLEIYLRYNKKENDEENDSNQD